MKDALVTTPLLSALQGCIDLTPIRHETESTRAGCTVWSGFCGDGDLDGYADELIWTHALQGERPGCDDLVRSAPYFWSLRKGREILAYIEGDVFVTVAPTLDLARQAWGRELASHEAQDG